MKILVGGVISLKTVILIHDEGIPAAGDNTFHLGINGSIRHACMTNSKVMFSVINQ